MKVPISVVIPCYNSERFIAEAIESVQNQTMEPDEIIVVDNNCVDNTVEIAEKMGAKVVKQPKQGLPCARNKGIEHAKNDWVAILDSDDVWLNEKIEYQLKAIEKFPTAEIITCQSESFYIKDSEVKFLGLKRSAKPTDIDDPNVIVGDVYNFAERISYKLYWWFAINASTALFHRNVFEKVGVFDESLLFREEIEFLCVHYRHRRLPPFRKFSLTFACIHTAWDMIQSV